MKLEVPFRKQVNDYMCGPAAMQMVLAFFGQQASQRKIRKLMSTSPKELKDRGTDNHKLVRGIQKAGLYAYVNEDSSLEELKFLLSQGHPIIVSYIEPSEDEGHIAVVIGFNSLLKQIILNDPWNGQGFKVSDIQFLRRWHSHWDGHRRWLMAISKEPFKIGRQFYPLKSRYERKG